MITHRQGGSLLAVAFFWLTAAASSLQGGVAQYPRDTPSFSVTVPTGWTTKTDGEGVLHCAPSDESEVAFYFRPLPPLADDGELQEALRRAAKSVSASFKNPRVTDVVASKNGSGVAMYTVEASGASETFTFTGFSTEKGKYFVAIWETSAAKRAHEKDVKAMIESIKLLTPGDGK